MGSRLGVRQNTLPLNPNAFYRLYNENLPGYTMSLGKSTYQPGPFNMTTEALTSTENWQLYAQGGRYFIRNYDHAADYQLALDEASRESPIMLRRSGDLGHQWSIIGIEEGADKGKWRITNGLLGNGTMLAMGSSGTIPQMSPGEDGSAWDIRMNIDPASRQDVPQNMDMMINVLSMEVASSSTTSSSSSTPSQTLSPTSSPTSSFSSIVTSSSSIPAPKSSNLQGGAIAGIVISGVLFIAAIFALVFVLLKRRKRNMVPPYQQHYATHYEKPAELEVYERRQELGTGQQGGYRKSQMHTQNVAPVEMG